MFLIDDNELIWHDIDSVVERHCSCREWYTGHVHWGPENNVWYAVRAVVIKYLLLAS
jgi:hypothetical protein